MSSRGLVSVAVVALLQAGCVHSARPARSAATAPTATVKIGSEEEYALVHAGFDVLPAGDPRREATRRGLEGYLIAEARRELGAGRPDAAWEAFQRALSLWDAADLAAPPPDEPFVVAAADLERQLGRRGAHREALTALAVQIALRPGDAEARGRFDRIVRWLRGEHGCEGIGCERVIEDLEATVSLWPSPFVVEQLAGLYWARQQGGGAGGEDAREAAGHLDQLIAGHAAARTGVDLARLYLRVSRPEAALEALRKLGGQPGDDPQLRESIERYLSTEARPLDAIAVAAQFARDPANRAVGERVCIDAAHRFPAAAEPQLCVGEVAMQLEQVTVAIQAFERAVAISPDKREAWEALARLHQARLFQLVGDERTDELEAYMKKVEAFHAEARKRFAAEPLHTSLAGALFEVGRGYYNAGRVDGAVRYLQRSLAIEPTPYAAEQLATIEIKRDRGPEAKALLDVALGQVSVRLRGAQQTYWLAKLHRSLGDTLDGLGDPRGAEEARRSSLAAWLVLLSQRQGPLGADELSEAELERGKLLYQLGERDRAIAAFERAIDVGSERGSTYADVLSFLVPRGERGEALDAFHRVLGRGGISEYLKVYCSLWIVDLDRRSGEAEDPLARTFLESVDGGKWYHDLARWATGRESEAELQAHADTPSKQAESSFYRAMRRLEDGRTDEAQALWRKVIETRMMAFFEFDMASYYLHHLPVVHAAATKP
jgi:tetratricopeptide (TPR) repeat protein